MNYELKYLHRNLRLGKTVVSVAHNPLALLYPTVSCQRLVHLPWCCPHNCRTCEYFRILNSTDKM